jgi:polyisoprenyl-phosphate glycosyltransferase
MMKRLSMVVPFFNEQAGIPAFAEAMQRLSEDLGDFEFEFVCVDDGSRDGTLDMLVDLARRDPRYRVIELSRNFGKEAALTAGLMAATGDAVIPFDADLQDPPALIPEMIEAWEGGADVVLAKRVDRNTDSWLKRKTAALFYSINVRLSQVSIPENVGDFRLMSHEVVEALRLLPERQRFMKGLLAWLGFRTVTIGYVRAPRSAGLTKFTGWKLWNFALEGITSFSTLPLRIWTYIGGLCALATFFYGAVVIVKALLFGADVRGYTSTMAVILFFGSLQLMSVGLLGEYIGRIYMETKLRPIYLVRREYRFKGEREGNS